MQPPTWFRIGLYILNGFGLLGLEAIAIYERGVLVGTAIAGGALLVSVLLYLVIGKREQQS